MASGKDQDVIVIGAGLAGLAAANALAGEGARVRLLERRPLIGGRAYSYLHPALEETVDSQHVLLGCCTNLIDLCQQAGIADKVRWYDEQTFLEPATASRGVRASTIARSALPVPMQYAGSFLGAAMLSLADKIAVARGLMEFTRGSHGRDEESVAQWYARTRQTRGAIDHFWEPIVLATLNDSAANCSMKYAAKVFYEIFLKTADGGRLGIPTVPLSEFYSGLVQRFKSLGGTLELKAGVEGLSREPDGCWSVQTSAGAHTAKDVILAVPFEQSYKLLASIAPQDDVEQDTLRWEQSRFTHAPFISILLWYDRQITDLDHAWLLDTTIQWFFHKSKIRGYAPERGSYVELVIAGSRKELPLSRAEILGPALAELERFFPDVRQATLLKSGILKEARATFSVTPWLDGVRPMQQSQFPGLYLAGDWTATDWPSTMESAVRSGRLAAGAVLGQRERLLTPELAPEGIMRWLSR